MGCCFRAGTFAVQDDCTSGQLNHNTRDTQDRNTAYDGCQLSRVECQGQPANQAGESSSGARKVAGRTQQWKFFASKRTSRARNQRPASTDASAAACKSSSKGEGSGSTPGSSSSSKSRASTASSCMSGCFLRRSHCRTTAPGWEGTSSAASKGTTTPRNRLLSLQSSGSLIPAGFLQPPPTSTVGDGSSSGSPTAAALSHSAPLSSSAPGTTSAAGAKASCAEADAGQKQQGQHSSINTSTALNSSNEGDSSALAPTGLTLVVSSHSSSSLHGSPRCEQGDGPSRSGSSSRASSDSGHTAFASIPSIVHSSASPDSMLSAFSTTSSCFSTNCGGSCCATSMHPAAAATAAVLKAAAAAVNPAAEYSEQQQQQPWLTLQDASSVQQLHLDIDAETHSPSAPQQQHQTVNNQQQEQEHVVPQLQQQQAPASILGVASTAVQQQQQQPSLGSPYASVGDLIQAASQPERPQQQQQPEFWRSSGWSFSSHSEQNLRSYQEDRTVAIDLTGHSAFQPSERAGLFSVYDGHGGHQVAEFLAEHVKGALLEAGPDTIADAPLSVLGQAVEDAERQLLSSYTDGNSTAAAGSTLCAVLMIDDKLHVAHVGDSRAILARGSAAKQLTRDHKPACAIEAKRIMSDDPDAEITPDGYLYSELAVARAIGSAHLKRDPSRRALIATAETVTVQLQRQDDFVIVATDGLWDTVSNSEAVSVARRVLIDTKDAAAASRALVERAQKCGSSDNISVVTLLLHSRGITVPRSNSRLFKRTPSQQQSFAGASSSADGGSSLPAYTQPSAGASSGADGNSSNNSKATPA